MCNTPFYASSSVPIRRRGGFTLIEILIVVIILGILAGIVLPQFSNASTLARESTLKEDLRYLRTQLSVFKVQHRDVLPGYPGGDVTVTPDEATFRDHMLKFTDAACGVSATPSYSYPFGPYLTQMPPNPVNGKNKVLVVTGLTMPPADDSQPYGWIYNVDLQRIQVNLTGNDTTGSPYANY